MNKDLGQSHCVTPFAM